MICEALHAAPHIFYGGTLIFDKNIYLCPSKLLRGVIGNTSDSGSEESRFEPWRSNCSRFIPAFSFRALSLPSAVF